MQYDELATLRALLRYVVMNYMRSDSVVTGPSATVSCISAAHTKELESQRVVVSTSK